MRFALASFALIVSAAAAGCGSPDPIDRLQSAGQVYIDDVCTRCPMAFSGTTTELQCRAAAEMQLLSETEEGCIRDVYRAHQTELDAYYDCIIPATDAFSRCIRTAIDTCPPTTEDATACSNSFSAAVDSCPDLTASTASELAACTSP